MPQRREVVKDKKDGRQQDAADKGAKKRAAKAKKPQTAEAKAEAKKKRHERYMRNEHECRVTSASRPFCVDCGELWGGF